MPGSLSVCLSVCLRVPYKRRERFPIKIGMFGSGTAVASEFVGLRQSGRGESKLFFCLKLKQNFADFLRIGSSYKKFDLPDIKCSLSLVETCNLHFKHPLKRIFIDIQGT
jgi:hypothetical protein